MTKNIQFSQNGNAPINAKFLNHESLEQAWSRVIGRAWLFQKEYAEDAKSINTLNADALKTDDHHWYKNLLSQEPELVKKAFIDEGLVTLGTQQSMDSDFDYSQWITSDIYVINFDQQMDLVIPASKENKEYNIEENTSNGWSDVNGIDHTVILSLPEAPSDAAEFALALADYCCAGKTYVFTG
jgi:hypothetical protein